MNEIYKIVFSQKRNDKINVCNYKGKIDEYLIIKKS
jgi:hypothetical protein